jgi:hypothetical protein
MGTDSVSSVSGLPLELQLAVLEVVQCPRDQMSLIASSATLTSYFCQNPTARVRLLRPHITTRRDGSTATWYVSWTGLVLLSLQGGYLSNANIRDYLRQQSWTLPPSIRQPTIEDPVLRSLMEAYDRLPKITVRWVLWPGMPEKPKSFAKHLDLATLVDFPLLLQRWRELPYERLWLGAFGGETRISFSSR